MPSAASRPNASNPDDRGHANERRSRGTREADVGQRVAGEARAAQHHEVADEPGHDGDERACQEGILHEVIVQQLLRIGDQVPGRAALKHGRRPPPLAALPPGYAHRSCATPRPGVVEPRERLGRDNLVRRTDQHPATCHIEHPVEVGQDGIHIMCHEQRRDPLLLADRADHRRHRLLVGQVQAFRGSSSSSRRGCVTSAWAIKRRCCSPPETAPMGRSA